MESHPVQCQCGAIRGQLDVEGMSNRAICYCTDCRAFARYLGRADVLDEQGGTEIVQVSQPRLRFSQGIDRLAAVRLSEKGLMRWYASCCQTPIGNTMADAKVPFIGMIHACLEHARMDQDFGVAVALVHTQAALGDPKPKQRGLLGAMARFIWIVVSARFSGQYKNSPFFDPSGLPIAAPTILATPELGRLKRPDQNAA